MKRLTIEEAVALLRANDTVALPTETVYGLAARADSDEAVAGIFRAKGRPAHNPLICHVSSVEMLERYAIIHDADRPLFRFWPGPLTILLPRKTEIPDVVTAGSPLCAFRIPDNDIFLRVIEAVGAPLAAPSANRSGRTSPVTADMVESSLEGRIPGVVDGGQCRVGLESTVVLRRPDGCIEILRPGGITARALQDAGFQLCPRSSTQPGTTTTNTETDTERDTRPDGGRDREAMAAGADPTPPEQRGLLSPGMLPAHYAPSIPLLLIEETAERGLAPIVAALGSAHPTRAIATLQRNDTYSGLSLRHLLEAPHRLALLLFLDPEAASAEGLAELERMGITVLEPAPRGDLNGFARSLYASLEAAAMPHDAEPRSAILSFIVADEGLGVAINDRLRRASTFRLALRRNPL